MGQFAEDQVALLMHNASDYRRVHSRNNTPIPLRKRLPTRLLCGYTNSSLTTGCLHLLLKWSSQVVEKAQETVASNKKAAEV